MRIKKANLEWYAIIPYEKDQVMLNINVLDNFPKEDVRKKIKKKDITCYAELYAYIRKWLMYHYWSKCEWEMLCGELFSDYKEPIKLDIFRQLEPNLDRITEYIIKEMDIKF